jgi:hypothetical protein
MADRGYRGLRGIIGRFDVGSNDNHRSNPATRREAGGGELTLPKGADTQLARAFQFPEP